MPPPKTTRMTQNQGAMARYRPGKAEAESESEEESSDEESEAVVAKPTRPAATTFRPTKTTGVILSRGDQKIKSIPKPAEQVPDLEGFQTASSSSDDGAGEDSASEEEGDDSDEDDESSEEEDSSDDEPQRPLVRPVFMSKAKRLEVQQALNGPAVDEQREVEDERKRKEKADELLQAQLERAAAARAAGRKAWDDDADIEPEDEINDTDGVDPEAEHAAWKLRELKRVKRDRMAIEAQEKEREEIERRRNLTQEERDAEDKAYIAAQEEERKGKGKMAFMQRYHHKGAFFHHDDEQDEEVKAALNRDFAGVRFEDETGDKSVLPEYMRIRDMTRLGKKGRTRYKDLKSEDTGQWGDSGRKREQYGQLDERFRPDSFQEGGEERTGANNAPIGERRRREGDDSGERYEKRPRYD